MATASLNATARTDRGTGVARKLRASGSVPAVIYGHGREPQSLTINTREIDKLLSQIAAESTVIELNVDGAKSNTLIREIQRHPFKRHIVHVDFQQLVAGEKVTVSVPLRFHGTPDGVRLGGGILEETMHQVHLRLDPANIPNHLDVDVTPLTIGHNFHVRDLVLPEGISVLDEPGATVCLVAAPKAATETTTATEGTEAKAEPELIRKTKAEEEEAKK
jgi:large subunit ribosomal protein L25